MMFHLEKFTTIHIFKKRMTVQTGYQLHGHTLESVQGGKYLGVHISKDLSMEKPHTAGDNQGLQICWISTKEPKRMPKRCRSQGIHNSS